MLRNVPNSPTWSLAFLVRECLAGLDEYGCLCPEKEFRRDGEHRPPWLIEWPSVNPCAPNEIASERELAGLRHPVWDVRLSGPV